MKRKLSRGIVAAAVLAYWAMYPFAATSVEWSQGLQITEDMTISSDSNFSGYTGPNQGVLVNWGNDTVTVSGDNKALFENNIGVQDAGGALYNAYGATTIVDAVSEFTNNHSNRGGAVWNNGVLTFNQKATFDGNYATNTAISNDMAGGAITNSSYESTATSGLLTFNNGVEFKNNTAIQGGAVKQGGKIVVKGGATFDNNRATGGNGGAVLNAAGWGEPAREDIYDRLTVTNNSATGNGGAYSVEGYGSLTVTDKADFQNNNAGANGGAVYSEGTVNLGNNADIQKNHAVNSGGAIYNEGSFTIGDKAVIKDNYISSATLTNSGGAIYNTAGDITIGKEALFEGNYVIGQLDPTGDGTQGASGGAIASWNAGNVTIGETAQFIKNGSLTTMTDGGAIYFSGDATTSETSGKGILTIGANSTFDGNLSKERGGAVYNGDGIVTTENNVTFKNNESNSGGAIYSLAYYSSETSIKIGDENKFLNNTAKDNSGGAIMAVSDMTVGKKSEFTGNTSGYAGGAIKNYGTASIGEGAKFDKNTAKADDMGGGAISNSASLTIGKSATFTNNNATNAGGAIHNNGTQLVVKGDTTFSNNTATNSGGAIYNAGTMNLDTADGDITFSNNMASSIANDILAATDSNTSITGSNNVSIGSGIVTEAGSGFGIKDTANLVIEKDATGLFNGSITSDEGAMLVNNGTTEFAGTESNASSANVKNNADLTISGDSRSEITNDGKTVVTGKYNGKFVQKDKDSSVEIAKNSEFTVGDGTAIEGGILKISKEGKLIGDISVTEAVKIEIEGGSTVIDADGLVVTKDDDGKVIGHIVQQVGPGSGALNLSGDYTVAGGTLGTSVIISNGSINADPAGPLTINDKTLILSDNATSNDKFVLNSDTDKGTQGTLQLAPTVGKSMTLTDANKVEGTGNVLVDEIVVNQQDYDEKTGSYVTKEIHKGVGTVNVASDNSGFTGNFLQKMGTVIAKAGSKFFGGENEVTGSVVTVDGNDVIHNSKLVLQDGADLTTTVAATASADGKAYGTIDIYNAIKGEIGEDGVNRIDSEAIYDEQSGNVVLDYINSDGSTNEVTIQAAGLGLFNGTRITGDIELDSDTVRDLTFGNGSGSEAESIILNKATKLTYKDNAYIRDDSTVFVGKNASLNFANETTKVEYRPVITSEDATALITKTGAGETVISSTLKDFSGSVEANGGSLDLANTDDISLNNVIANNSNLHIAANVEANSISVANAVFSADKTVTADNLSVNNSSATIVGETNVKTANFTGANSVVNLKGSSFFDNVNLTDATLAAANNVTIANTMTINSTPGNTPSISLVNGGTNTITAKTLNMQSNANIAFDLDPRSKAIDSIVADSIVSNPDSPYKLLITGINMTRSPIDRNVAIDISNLLQDANGSQSDMVALADGGVIARTAMGDYAITATSASNMFNASLLAINPQMYRGQVATLASWQNQLVVNNMMFDHMNVLSRQLMDDAKTANKYSAILPQFAPYQYSVKDGSLWYKAYGNFERLSMTRGLSVGNNAYGSLIGADFPLVDLKNGWKLVPTAYVAYNGAHQTYDGVSMYQNGAQLGLMGTAYKGDFLTSLLVYGGGYGNDMSVRGSFGSGNDTTGNWFAGVASKTAYNIHLPKDFIFQPTAMVTYNAFGNQNWGSNFGAMSMSASMLNGINVAPGFNLIWNKKTFSLYATAQMVYNIMGGVDGRAGNVDLGYVRMRHSYFEYGFGAMKHFKDTFNGYLQMTFRNGGRTGVGFQGGIQWKPGKDKK